jgi:MFS family permease
MLDGLKHSLRIRSFWLYLLIYFTGMGIFNGITTWIENIIRPRGFTPTDAGVLGAVLLLGGLFGAVILPALSDKLGLRKPFILLGVILAIPGLIGLTYATTYWLLLASGFALGFFITSVAPIGMQYCAEITQPTPEGTSTGLIQLFGQASVVFVYLMEALRSADGAFTPALLAAVGLLVVSALAATRMEEAGKSTPVPAAAVPLPASQDD